MLEQQISRSLRDSATPATKSCINNLILSVYSYIDAQLIPAQRIRVFEGYIVGIKFTPEMWILVTIYDYFSIEIIHLLFTLLMPHDLKIFFTL
jgi:hypothetical protein